MLSISDAEDVCTDVCSMVATIEILLLLGWQRCLKINEIQWRYWVLIQIAITLSRQKHDDTNYLRPGSWPIMETHSLQHAVLKVRVDAEITVQI